MNRTLPAATGSIPRTGHHHRRSFLDRLTAAGVSTFALALMVFLSRRHTRSLRRQLVAALAQASHDELTGLPNRHAALEILQAGPVGMVGLLDLDDFKSVNDTYGHDTGDQLLSVIARRLRTVIGESGMATRLAGDEFVLIWHTAPPDPLLVGQNLISQVSAPARIDGHQIVPAASLGLSIPPSSRTNATALLSAVDQAMYDAKHAREDRPAAGAVHLYDGPHPPVPVHRPAGPARRATRDLSTTASSGSASSLGEGGTR